MTDTATASAPPQLRRSRGLATGIILVLGVLVVPLALTFSFNSWEAPDAAAYVRMAFASVAGSTIAIATVWGLLIRDIVHRNGRAQIATALIIALFVSYLAVSGIGAASRFLLQGLSTVS
jgi:hypothetical protein